MSLISLFGLFKE